MTVRDWSFMLGRSIRRRRRICRGKKYKDEGELDIVAEVNVRATGLRWKARTALKFVDDGLILTKVNMRSGKESFEGGRRILTKHYLQT